MTYADHVKAEVAARYGVPVRCDVQIIPRGVSGIDPTLPMNWLAVRDRLRQAHQARPVEVPPKLSIRQTRLKAEIEKCQVALLGELDPLVRTVLALRCEGKNFRQIAAETGKAVSMVHGIVKRAGQ
ncbi:sigma-70 RNA polymerase sigma factor region 4 domain-containing protein [Paracoccus denitrificans]|uniref:sigma-70 family RNA polymerase sigma factor n=1 Tax=Paracoccus denitrificans TaxID=266 RepID=UPI000CEBC560|nr:sigma-70 family RNA polymerase sigma factor [Paracoccus denitrificans]